MKSFDKNLELAIIFLSLSITTQIMIGLSFFGKEWIPFSITTALASWMFISRAMRELKKEFREIGEVVG